MSADELKEMLEQAASYGNEILFDDFYFIMTKKTFTWPEIRTQTQIIGSWKWSHVNFE